MTFWAIYVDAFATHANAQALLMHLLLADLLLASALLFAIYGTLSAYAEARHARRHRQRRRAYAARRSIMSRRYL